MTDNTETVRKLCADVVRVSAEMREAYSQWEAAAGLLCAVAAELAEQATIRNDLEGKR